MAKLLCVCPWLDQVTRYGRIPAALIPRWGPHFEKIGIWSVHGNPGTEETTYGPVYYTDAPMEKRWAHLGDVVQGGWTHVWIMGDIRFLDLLASKGLTSENLPGTMVYAYAFLQTPFLNPRYANTPSHFDFFVTVSNMTTAAVEEAAKVTPPAGKEGFKALQHILSIPPGVESNVFRPLEVCRREFGREELRVGFFGDKVNGADMLILLMGAKSLHAGLPQAFATIKLLKEKQPNHSIKTYCHMNSTPESPDAIDLYTLAGGNELEVGKDIFFGDNSVGTFDDKRLNYLYNAADLLLCTHAADGWCFSVMEAMSAGKIVAAPDEHVWGEVISDNAGILLPTTQFGWAPWDNKQYIRTVEPDKAAIAIAEVMGRPEKMDALRSAARTRATLASWDSIALQWLKLFGLQ